MVGKDYKDPRTMSDEENYQYLLDNIIEHCQILKAVGHTPKTMHMLVCHVWPMFIHMVPEEKIGRH